jgi:hypothetical protein
MLSVVMLCVTIKSIMMGFIRLGGVMFNVDMMNVGAPFLGLTCLKHFLWRKKIFFVENPIKEKKELSLFSNELIRVKRCKTFLTVNVELAEVG